ncbi:MAG: bifunctional phosphopantothenoylcysteine decarboxylase/phosphopantothenate--cysteine ligase CoaBC [Legionella sp.]|nr:MAG: bifunctional phosphopantothenoylcysteine decarboxylase/phosphopantothenate--cysteine ligase CoaBC [Legionella sp.]
MSELSDTKIVLGICGGIAAYKAAYLVRELCAAGAVVRVVMTKAALAFIQPMTFQALSGEDVRCELLDDSAERAMGHIELARWADYLLIAPASADFMAKMTHGLADDLLSTLYLASKAPTIICPAMNQNMWAHPATIANCAVLEERGVMVIGPDDGSQACGDVGLGRMAEGQDIIAALRLYAVKQLLKGQNVVITAGPTREAIDPVRYISNHSSGKMGYALAQAAYIAGANVTLISGPTHLKAPLGVDCVRVDSTEEMLSEVLATLKPGVLFIGAAAIADYQVLNRSDKKLKKQREDTMNLTLKKNPDILSAVVSSQLATMVIGFAAETHDVLINAEEKLRKKHLDMIIANQVGDGLGFDKDINQVTVITHDGCIPLDLAPKMTLAGQIITIIATSLQNTASRNVHEPFHSN